MGVEPGKKLNLNDPKNKNRVLSSDEIDREGHYSGATQCGNCLCVFWVI